MTSLLGVLGQRIDDIKSGDFSGLEKELEILEEIPPEAFIDAAVYLRKVSPTNVYDALLTILDTQFRGVADRRKAVAEYKRRFHEVVGPEIPEELRTVLAMYD